MGLRGLLTGFALSYLDPFAYDASGLELRPSASIPLGAYSVSARPRLAAGRWTTDAVEGDLRIGGGDLVVERVFGAVSGAVSAGIAQVENGVTTGAFSGADARLTLDRGVWSLTGTVELQRTPLETELGGSLRGAWVAASGLHVTASAGRRVRDPLFGTAGSLSFSLGVSFRPVRWSPPAPPPVVAVGEIRGDGRVVHFAIEAVGAGSVTLSGDFTGWEPVAMERTGDGWWQTRQILQPGLHHFGFLVDGQWVVPADAPGIVDDGWGRQNASIVVQP